MFMDVVERLHNVIYRASVDEVSVRMNMKGRLKNGVKAASYSYI
jgi:hypothetical protein